jgi:large subunit ribosomal protein L6
VSRIGKKPIILPEGVKATQEGDQVVVEGPKGRLAKQMIPGILIEIENNKILVGRQDNKRQSRACHGLMRALLANMVAGVHKGFEKALEISGVGYRAEKAEDRLVLHLGYSHKVELEIPKEVDVVVEKPNRILVKSIDFQKLGQVAADIRATRKPDPYKLKGITYEGEKIVQKAGKKAVS